MICSDLLQNHSKIAATHSNLIDVDIIKHCTARCSSQLLPLKWFWGFFCMQYQFKGTVLYENDLFFLKNLYVRSNDTYPRCADPLGVISTQVGVWTVRNDVPPRFGCRVWMILTLYGSPTDIAPTSTLSIGNFGVMTGLEDWPLICVTSYYCGSNRDQQKLNSEGGRDGVKIHTVTRVV